MSGIDFHSVRDYRLSNELFFLFFTPRPPLSPPPPQPERDRSRNNITGTGCVNQHSFMAPHYAKRRAKGAWHFLSFDRRIRKDRLRLPSIVFLLFDVGLNQRHHCSPLPRLSRRHALVAIRKTHCISSCQERSFRQELVHDSLYRYANFTLPAPWHRLTFRYIEPIDRVRYLANDFVNCSWSAKKGGATESAAVGWLRTANRDLMRGWQVIDQWT